MMLNTEGFVIAGVGLVFSGFQGLVFFVLHDLRSRIMRLEDVLLPDPKKVKVAP